MTTSLALSTLPTDDVHHVEWSRLSTIVSGGDVPASPSDVLQWVKTSPLRAQLNVQLRHSTKDANVRQIRRSLQAMGCNVTSLTSFC